MTVIYLPAVHDTYKPIIGSYMKYHSYNCNYGIEIKISSSKQCFRYWHRYWFWCIYILFIISIYKISSKCTCLYKRLHRNPTCTKNYSYLLCTDQQLLIKIIFQMSTSLLILIHLRLFMIISINKMMWCSSKHVYLPKILHVNPVRIKNHS